MRLKLAAAAAVVLGLAPVSGAYGVTVWQGDAVITAATGCGGGPFDERRNIGVGTVIKSVLRPKNVDNNGPDTRVSFNHDSGANFVIFLPSGAMPSGIYAAFGATHSGLIVANRAREYIQFDQSPNTIDANDVFVRLSGRIEDFMFIDGCDATFRASYSKRP